MVCCNSPSAVSYNWKSIFWCARYIEFLSSVSSHMEILTCRPRVTLGSNQFLSIPWFLVFISIASNCVALLSNSCYFQAILEFPISWRLGKHHAWQGGLARQTCRPRVTLHIHLAIHLILESILLVHGACVRVSWSTPNIFIFMFCIF